MPLVPQSGAPFWQIADRFHALRRWSGPQRQRLADERRERFAGRFGAARFRSAAVECLERSRWRAEGRGDRGEEASADARHNDNHDLDYDDHDHDHDRDVSSDQGSESVRGGGGGGDGGGGGGGVGGGDARRGVLGVASPGLGVGIFSGLSNQQQCLVGLVLLASKQAGSTTNNGNDNDNDARSGRSLAPISLQSLRWRTTFESEDAASAFVGSEVLWDLSVWRTLARQGKLPEIVDAPPTKR